GLIPARPLLPSWKTFIPFSKWSPIQPFPPLLLRSAPPPTSGIDWFLRGWKAGFIAPLSSPLVFVCLEHFLERWIYDVVYEAIESTIIHPTNPDLLAPDDGTKNRAAILGLREKSPSLIRNTIRKFLAALGWGAVPSSESVHRTAQSVQR